MSFKSHVYLLQNIRKTIERAIGNTNPHGLSITDWLDSKPEPVEAKQSFYRFLYSELIEHTLQSYDENLVLMGELLDRGINIIEFVGHDLCPNEGYASVEMQLLPTLAMGAEGIRDGLPNYEQYCAAVQQMDKLYTRALAFSLSLKWTGENWDLAFTTPESMLFAVLRETRDGFHYLAHSTLTARCMDKWLEDLPNISTHYRECMWAGFSSFFSYPSEITPEPYKPLAKALVLSMTKGFSRVLQADAAHQPQPKRQFSLRQSDFNHLDFSHEQSQELAIFLHKGGCYKEASLALYPLLQVPGLFAEALRVAGVNDSHAQEYFFHCLGMRIFELKTINGPEFQASIDDCRAAFLAYGYPDLKGTRALDGCLIHVQAAEYLHSIDYLRGSDAALGTSLLVLANLEPTVLGEDYVVKMAHRAVDIAIKTGQQATMATLVGDFLAGSRSNCRFHNGCVVKYFLEVEPVPASEIINSEHRFRIAWSNKVLPPKLLLDGKFRPYVEGLVAKSLSQQGRDLE